MADSKVSALPAASTLTGSELMYVIQGGVSKHTTMNNLFPNVQNEFYRQQMLDYLLRTDPPALQLDFLNQKYRVNQQDKAWADLFTFSGAGGGTRINPLGAVEAAVSGSPRFDYDPVTRKPMGLLIEEARTNLLLQNDALNTTPWSGLPTATTNGEYLGRARWELAKTTTGGSEGRTQAISVNAGVTYTARVYLWAGNTQQAGLGIYHNASWAHTTATKVSGPGILTSNTGGNLPSVTGLSATEPTVIDVFLVATTATTGSLIIYPGYPSSTIGDSCIVQANNFEAGSFATSYIPTTSAAVTRAVDSCKIDSTRFSDWYRQDEGTIVVVGRHNNENSHYFSLDDGTASNRIYMAAGTTVAASVVAGGAAGMIQYIGSLTLPTRISVAIASKVNDSAAAVNGSIPTTDTSVTSPTGVNVLRIGRNVSAVSLNGHSEFIFYWPRRVDNTTLQILSTL